MSEARPGLQWSFALACLPVALAAASFAAQVALVQQFYWPNNIAVQTVALFGPWLWFVAVPFAFVRSSRLGLPALASGVLIFLLPVLGVSSWVFGCVSGACAFP